MIGPYLAGVVFIGLICFVAYLVDDQFDPGLKRRWIRVFLLTVILGSAWALLIGRLHF